MTEFKPPGAGSFALPVSQSSSAHPVGSGEAVMLRFRVASASGPLADVEIEVPIDQAAYLLGSLNYSDGILAAAATKTTVHTRMTRSP